MPRPRVTLVGCGRWGTHILRDLRALGCDVVVVDVDVAARERARSDGAVAIAPSLADTPLADGIIVATPARTHGGLVAAALERGVPVFCEKPLATSAAAAARLAALGGERLFVMDKWRYHPGVEALRDMARSGEIGSIIGLRTTRRGPSAPHVDADPIWTLAPHDLSIALEILGAIPEPRAAVAERADGRPIALVALLGVDPWMVLDVAVDAGEVRREIRVRGERATAVLPDAYSDHVLVVRTTGSGATAVPEKRTISTEPPLLRELRAFRDHVSGGPAPKSGGGDGARVVSVLSRLRELAGIDPPSPTDWDGRTDAER